MIRFVLSFFGAIFTLVTLSVAVIALSIGAVFWIYGRDLPSHEALASYQPKTISRIYSGEGRIIDEFAQERRLFTPASEIPKLVKEAFISAEDKNFYHHAGYDTRGMMSAAFDAIKSRGKNVRGASTITQQVMKNFLLTGDRKIERKIKEIILASRLEETLPKDKILELYLNEIFLGQNSYGVTAAAQTYFNKPLSELSPAEAATLASMPKAPSDYHPVRNHDRLLQRRDYVLREMHENGYIDDYIYAASVAEPIRSVQGGDYPGFRSTLPPRDYFTDEIRRQLTQDFGEDEFFTGGFTVRATIDPEMQADAAMALRHALEKFDRTLGRWRGTGKALDEAQLADETTWRDTLRGTNVPRDITLEHPWLPAVVFNVADQTLDIGIEDVANDDPRGHSVPRSDIHWLRGDFHDNFKRGDVVLVREVTDDSGAFVNWSLRQVPEVEGGFMAMDVNNGRVIAMQGGFSYQASVFNRATQANRQPGSSFKPFVYASALDSGYTPATIVIDAPIEVNTPDGVWRPTNSSNQYYGPTPLRTGIEQSRNLMTIRLAQEVGMDVVAEYAERFGVYDNMGTYLANALGSEETTLYKMVAAYAMFANGGERVEPTLVDRVQDRNGHTIYRHDHRICNECREPVLPAGEGPEIISNSQRVMNAITAYQLTSMMQGVVQRGTAARVVNLPVPTAGKTGTTNDARDAWFIGFTSNLVAGCYIGYDNPRSMMNGHGYGGTLCGPVFQEFMTKAIKEYGGGAFKVPPGGHFINIDRFTGARLSDDASGNNVVAEYFRDGEEPIFGITYDGGFAMGSDLPLFRDAGDARQRQQITTSTGERTTIAPKANFGTLSSGGLY
ncbi:PBP1A family penicillin-binding protein [Pseudooceanicola sediminis]|uniref:Penicillin-binding protein 1A n=1 Tax=Pseudooceanicola sediminis TaxID=2211117 RepID=A0A399J1U5_9RHOB|nr:PBP1A family penicillin-binding protein [Pseudooceanicola sediminis]KAA2314742.1 PBP1A family penicillin-binding protein [Puniceibacterium sp. HSS470]RII39305.1 PBP1A family penicillin-binding protein [Pseudooceanicola sediminis]